MGTKRKKKPSLGGITEPVFLGGLAVTDGIVALYS